jgi:hypothetical protein
MVQQQTNNKKNSGHQYNPHQHHVVDDHGSMSSVSAANSGATPSSVYMPSVPLSRDVSDLSGFSRASSSAVVPGQIIDPKSFRRPWKQAYVLSNQPPPPPTQEQDGKTASAMTRSNHQTTAGTSGHDATATGSTTRGASIWVPQNDVVEIFDTLQSSVVGLDKFQMMGHNRIPVLLLLMDPSRHCYELMCIWVDRTIDSIRDLVHALQHKLPPDRWRQAYDGIFQVRGQRFTQLINIIRLVKYDIQPFEVLVAKPWSMPAKLT